MADIAGLIAGNFWEEPTPDQRRFAEHVAKQIEAATGPTIAEQEKRIAELTAERDNWERTAVSAEEQLIGAEQALTTERRRREEAEGLAKPLSEGWAAYGNAEHNKLGLLCGTICIWDFSEAASYFAKYEASNG